MGQIAILLGVVGTVADHKHVTDREADKIDRNPESPPLRLVEQNAGSELADPALPQQGGGSGEGSAGIDDAVDQQYSLSGEASRDLADQPYLTTALRGRAVARQPQKLDLGTNAGPVERACEVGDKYNRSLEQRDDDKVARAALRDFAGERFDPRGDLGLADQNAHAPPPCGSQSSRGWVYQQREPERYCRSRPQQSSSRISCSTTIGALASQVRHHLGGEAVDVAAGQIVPEDAELEERHEDAKAGALAHPLDARPHRLGGCRSVPCRSRSIRRRSSCRRRPMPCGC